MRDYTALWLRPERFELWLGSVYRRQRRQFALAGYRDHPTDCPVGRFCREIGKLRDPHVLYQRISYIHEESGLRLSLHMPLWLQALVHDMDDNAEAGPEVSASEVMRYLPLMFERRAA